MKLTIDNIEQTINANSNLFVAGNVISEQQMCQLGSTKYRQRFGSVKERYQHQMRKLYIYTRFNKVLALRGLYIKSHDYYSTFEVLTAKDTAVRVEEYTHERDAKDNKAKALSLGATVHRSVWKPLSIAERAKLK